MLTVGRIIMFKCRGRVMNHMLTWLGVVTIAATFTPAWAAEDFPPVKAGIHLIDADPADARAANGPDVADDAAEIQPQVEERIELEMRPASVSLSRSLQFDERGNPQNEHENLSVQIRCIYPPELNPLSYELSDTQAVTAAGRKLNVAQRSSRSTIHHHRNHQGPASFTINCSMQGPIGDVRKIAHLTGKLELELGNGPLRRGVLGPYKDLRGKRITIAEMPDLEIGVTAEDDNQRVRVDYNGDAWRMLKEAKFYTAAGTELESRGWGGGSSGNKFHRSYRVALPEDGSIVLFFWDSRRSVTVPFRITDIPMPGALVDPEQPALVFHLEAIENPDNAVHPAVDDLEVIVE